MCQNEWKRDGGDGLKGWKTGWKVRVLGWKVKAMGCEGEVETV